jgi:hypothetical protein
MGSVDSETERPDAAKILRVMVSPAPKVLFRLKSTLRAIVPELGS